MIVDKINAYLSSDGKAIDESLLVEVAGLTRWSFIRQFGEREEKQGTLRLSSIGKCMRQQGYKLLNVEENGKQIDARAKMVFFMGDLTELAIVALSKAAGCDIFATGDQQSQIEIDGVVGHPDGLVRDSGKTWLLEIKSMSSFSFKDFERGVIDEGYRYQCNAYMSALGLDKCVIVALNKDAGVLAEQVISLNQEIVTDIRERIALIRSSTIETLPARPYKADDKGFLPWQCLYCPFWGTCWPHAEKVLVSHKYKLKNPKETPVYATPTPA